MCGKSGFSVTILENPEVFLEPDSERSSGLTGVLHADPCFMLHVGQFSWYIPLFSYLLLVSSCLVVKFFYGVICAKGDSDVSVLK